MSFLKSCSRYLLLIIPFFSFAYECQVGICAIFRDEARFLKEWIEYHKLVGVERFYLFNHNSVDHFREVLAPYVEEGSVELYDWTEEPSKERRWIAIQTAAYREGTRCALGVCKWLAFIDTDEFIFPVRDKTLPAFLDHFETYAAVVINWQVFGTSNISLLDPNQLMIEQLIHRAQRDAPMNRYIKTIAKTECIDLSSEAEEWSAHTVSLRRGCCPVNARYQKTGGKCDRTHPVDIVRIHHYQFRDEEFFFGAKLKRPNNTTRKGRVKLLLKNAKSCNEVVDDSITLYAPALRESMRINP